MLILSGLEEPHPNTSKATSKHGQDSVDEEICPGNSAPAPLSKGRGDISVALPKLTHTCVVTKGHVVTVPYAVSLCAALKARDFMTWGLIPVLVAITVLLLAVLLAVLLEPYIGKNCKSITLLVLLCGTSRNFL